jgi:hypothetical protein
MLYGNAAIAVEFDFKGPLFIFWQRRDRLALHRLNEGRFRARPNCLGIHLFRASGKPFSVTCLTPGASIIVNELQWM